MICPNWNFMISFSIWRLDRSTRRLNRERLEGLTFIDRTDYYIGNISRKIGCREHFEWHLYDLYKTFRVQ